MNSNESKKPRSSSGIVNGNDAAQNSSVAEAQIITMANHQNSRQLAHEVQMSSSEETPVAMMDPRDSQPRNNHKQQQQKQQQNKNKKNPSSESDGGVENRISPTYLVTTAAAAAEAAEASNTSIRDSSSANYIQAPSPSSTITRNLKHDSSGSNSASSGSGSENNGGTTSSSGNAAAVTSANNNTTSSGGSGDDDRSSSGSGTGGTSGSGSGGNRRSAGEASGEYYFAGYGSSVAGDGTQGSGAGAENATSAVPTQAANNNGMGTMNNDNAMLSFASFRGAPLAAASAAAAAGPRAHRPGGPPNNHHATNMVARHVDVATDEPPSPHHAFASSSHLRHHSSRHYHNNHRSRSNAQGGQVLIDTNDAANNEGTNNRGAAAVNAAIASRPSSRPTMVAHRTEPALSLNGGIPSAIDGPSSAARLPSAQQVHSQEVQLQRYRGTSAPGVSHHYDLRLSPSDEQAVLQRVPSKHAMVVAHDLPPPPTSSRSSSSSVWSSTSGSGGSANSKRSCRSQGRPMVASVRLANGGTVDSVNMSNGSSPSPSLGEHMNCKPRAIAMHVTMDDPILRKKIMLKHQHQRVFELALESMKPSSEAVAAITGPAAGNATSSKPTKEGTSSNNNAALKRKISAMSTARTGDDSRTSFDDSSDSAKESGSDEGYAASSEFQSGGSGSGSDSISSDGVIKKQDNAASSGHGGGDGAAGASKSNKMDGMTMAETSSMSSSLLADFSSVMNEEGSCTSLSSNDNHDDGGNNQSGGFKMMTDTQVKALAKSCHKRDSTHMLHASSANGARKRSKQAASLEAAKKPSSANAADGFGPAETNTMMSGLSIMEKSLQHHHHYHSRSTGRKMLEKSFLSAKRDFLSTADAPSALMASPMPSSIVANLDKVKFGTGKSTGDHSSMMNNKDASFQEASIYSLGQDVMAQVMLFLEPPEVHTFLTSPLSKTWLVTYTAPQELWKVLCTSKPFYAKLDESLYGSGSSDTSTCSFPSCNDLELRHLFGRYRLLYSSFVRCMKYLNRLQDDALNGRTPSVYSNGENQSGDIYPYHKNVSLKAYFAKARRLVRSSNPHSRRSGGSSGRSSVSDAALSITSESGSLGSNGKGHGSRIAAAAAAGTIGASSATSGQQKRRFAQSALTDRLLRPTQAGDVDNVNLPWSCAIYSVVNWTVAFADVEGIQIMCLKCLPYLLEDESQRTTAQRAGLTDSVLRAMALFPDSTELHTVAFHTLVLLARPLGGNEGMLFHTAMVNTRGIFNNGSSSNSKNGIVIMLDSMRRFVQDEILQAMSCWSLVNVALTPLQKSMLVKLGGLTVTSNAMLQHPYNAEVQFRALFALINLVIPTETRPDETEEMREFEREIFQQLGEVGETSEKEMLDASVGQISNLVVVGMKNFCSSEAILNRACLVLHNLSLNEEYHSILLWTPNCYQMLEWCLGNYPHDHVLQQSAGGTIQRLNATLSADEELRTRFTHSIREQQQHSLKMAREETVMLQEQQREQERQQMDVS
mmetsp:Transcript_4735/g.8426  ORF Transcript_4735/g.8426 Transcript_4735/m.8426 type:complete len:1499 (+) Transcript_4735:34-4530(+)